MSSKSRVAPGPCSNWLLGELLQVRRDRLDFVARVTREFGDVVRFRMGFRVLHLVSQPDSIRHVLQDNRKNYRKGLGLAEAKRFLGEGLTTSEGEVWSKQRHLIQPAFHRRRVAAFSSVVTEQTSTMLAGWRSHAERQESIDIAFEMMQLTLEIAMRAMFNVRVRNLGEIGAAFTIALRDAMDRMASIVLLPDWLPLPGRIRFRRALRTLHNTVDTIIEKHRQAAGMHELLLSATEHLLLYGDNEKAQKQGARDQVLTILLAGHETTAVSLAWTLYVLSRHPWAWLGIKAEVDRVLGGRVPTDEDIPQLTWTRMVFEESLRLYPPVWLIPRRSISDDELGGYRIPADSEVLISPYVMHRHPEYWDRPEVFDPERFSPDSAPRSRYIYFPFGAGPRACVGKSFAMMEALLILAQVVQRYRLEMESGFMVEPEPLLTLRFHSGLRMTPQFV